MPADLEFSGYLASSVPWKEGDELFLQPVYLVPVEVFTTGLLSRPEYKTVIAVVEAVGGRVSIADSRKTPKVIEGEAKGRKFPANITFELAVASAENEAASQGRGGWRALLGSSHVLARESEARACWKIWIRSGDDLIDSVTGKHFPVAEFLGLLLPQE